MKSISEFYSSIKYFCNDLKMFLLSFINRLAHKLISKLKKNCKFSNVIRNKYGLKFFRKNTFHVVFFLQNFSCSKVFCSKVKFTIVYYSIFSLGRVACLYFYAPGSNDRGHIVLVLSVANFTIRYNVWTVRDRNFIFGMHTPLMTPFQMTQRAMTLWPWLWSWS